MLLVIKQNGVQTTMTAKIIADVIRGLRKGCASAGYPRLVVNLDNTTVRIERDVMLQDGSKSTRDSGLL